FKDVTSLNDVERYKGYKLCVPIEEKIALSQDEYYVSDLIGLEVFDINNKKIGQVLDVMDNPANDILVLENDVLIPLVSAIVNEVNVEQGFITLFEIDGLW
ncbi:MAG: ribosome maturation factor RimM, partial [Bacilli bacterium]